MRHNRGRRGISEIVGVLIMLAVVVSLGVLAFTVASGSMNRLGESYSAAMSNNKTAESQNFAVEQVAFVTPTVTTPGVLSLDGSATGCFGATQTTPCVTGTTSGTVALTTSDSNDIIVVLVTNEDETNTAVRTVSTITATGLTFVERGTPLELQAPSYQDEEVWWALAASPLSVTITVTLSGATDDTVIVAFGVNGANTASPWDASTSLPAVNNGVPGTVPTVSGVYTTNAHDMILGFQANGNGAGTTATVETAGSGFTLIQNLDNEGGSNGEDGAAEYDIVSTQQSSATLAFGTATTASDYWLMIGDAIQASSSTAIPNLDGKGFTTQGTPTTTITAALTTGDADDVIIAIVTGQNSATGTYETPSASDSAGLSWSARSTLQEVSSVGGYSYYGQIFYAVSPTALSGDTIEITWNAAPTHYATLQVFAVSGANTASPFDTHSGLPAFESGSYTSVSTSNADDFVYGAELCDVTGSPTAGTGFTGIESGVGGTIASEYEIVSAPQSGLSVAFSNAGTDADGTFGDAIQAPSLTGADVFVRNAGTTPVTVASVYVTDTTTGSLVSQTTTSTTVNVGSYGEIPVSFSITVGHTYSFTVASSLGRQVVYKAEDL